MLNSLVALLITFSFAQKEDVRVVGNGGDGVVCRDVKTGQITSVEVLDSFEAREVLGWPMSLGSIGPRTTEIDLALRAVDRLMLRHPVTALFYRERIKGFMQDARIPMDMKLHEIDDANIKVISQAQGEEKNYYLQDNYLMLPNHCSLIQLAIRRDKTKVPDHKTFSINGQLWAKMSVVQRAILILHEVVYEDLLMTDEHGIIPFHHPTPDSRHARFMVAALLNPNLSKLEDADYLKLINLNGWFMEDFVPAELYEAAKKAFGGDKWTQFTGAENPVITKGRYKFRALRGSTIEENLGLIGYTLAENTTFQTTAGSFVAAAGSRIEFSGDEIATAYLAEDATFTIPSDGKVTVRGNRPRGPVPAMGGIL